MHNAPSVSYPVGRCRLAGVLLVLAWSAGAAALAAWASHVPAPLWQQALAAVAVAAAGLSAALGWARSAEGTLAWHGDTWDWQSGAEAAAGRVERILDLQHWVLVRWRAETGPARWLWLEAKRDPARWDALRRAVYSRARTEAPHTPSPPPAKS
jgi:toxin CptA